MNSRLIKVALGVSVLAAASVVSLPTAGAHHTGTASCDEVGIWTKSNRARNGNLTNEQQVNARVSYTPPTANCKPGWRVRWWKRTSSNYNVIDTSVSPSLSTQPGTIDYAGTSITGQTNYLNAKVTGSISPPTNSAYTLFLTADDGVKMWFDGTLVIDKWFDHTAPVTYQYTTPVLSTSADHDIVIEHYQKTGGQRLWLEWKRANTTDSRVTTPTLRANAASTQHSSLHARSADGTNCVETVAYRKSDGELLVYGYGCGQFEVEDADAEIISLGNYTEQFVTLWQKYNPMTFMNSWGHWVYRWDTGQWIFIGNTAHRPEYLQGWLESSGYNESVAHQTLFEYYKEGGTHVDFTVCPETEDYDAHQAMDPFQSVVSGDARFYPASNTQDTC